MAKKLTAAAVEQAKPAAVRREIADGGCTGLYLVVQANGAKSWAVRFRSPVERGPNGQRKAKKLTLGIVANGHDRPPGELQIGQPLSLADARTLATASLRKVENGVDPTLELRIAKAERQYAASRSDVIDGAMVEFLRRYRGKKKQGLRDSTRRQIAIYFGLKPDPDQPGEWIKSGAGVLKRWSGRPLQSISKRDVLNLVETMVDSGSPVSANRTLTVLKTFFTWLIDRDVIPASPAATVRAPAEEKSRERVLNDGELAALWRVAELEGHPFGTLVRLLILTAARRDELREAPWDEFDLDQRLWQLPGSRAKNGRDHHVPLVDDAIAILKAMPRIKSKKKLIFSTTGETPISGLARAKRRIDAAMLAELRKHQPKTQLAPWTLHDIRRTVASGLQRLQFPIEVVEAVLNHKSGTLRGVAGIYARHDYLPEKTAALESWARHVEAILKLEDS